jgi:hypothetical protein
MDRFVTNLGYPQPEILRFSMSAQSPSHSSTDWVVPRSFGNVLETARQMPNANRLPVWAWKQLGRSVKSGKKGIRILAPIVSVKCEKG